MTSTITGDAELKRKLSKLKDFSQLYPTLMAGGIHIKGLAATYPPSGPGNMPPIPYYIRGVGMQVSEGRNLGNSEDLGPSWTATGEGGTKVIIGNDTSYGPWVQDPQKQAAAMKKIGWKTTDDAVNEGQGKVLEEIKKKVDQILSTG